MIWRRLTTPVFAQNKMLPPLPTVSTWETTAWTLQSTLTMFTHSSSAVDIRPRVCPFGQLNELIWGKRLRNMVYINSMFNSTCCSTLCNDIASWGIFETTSLESWQAHAPLNRSVMECYIMCEANSELCSDVLIALFSLTCRLINMYCAITPKPQGNIWYQNRWCLKATTMKENQ